MNVKVTLKFVTPLIAVALLSACSGGGGGGTPVDPRAHLYGVYMNPMTAENET